MNEDGSSEHLSSFCAQWGIAVNSIILRLVKAHRGIVKGIQAELQKECDSHTEELSIYYQNEFSIMKCNVGSDYINRIVLNVSIHASEISTFKKWTPHWHFLKLSHLMQI